MRDRVSIGSAAVVMAAVLFGTSGTTQALLVPEAWPPSVAAVRLGVGALGLVVFVIWRGHSAQFRALLRQPLVWVMASAVAGYQVFFFIGVQNAGVATGTLVSLGAAPLLAGALGWLLGQGAVTPVWLGSTTVALVGLLLLVGGGSAQPEGVAAALLAGLSYAVYTVLGTRLARAGSPPDVVMAVPFALGAVMLVPFLHRAEWVLTGPGLMLAVWLGLAATTLAYLLFGVGLTVLPPGQIATLTLAEPVTATVLGVVLLSESLAPRGWLGCGLILLALLVLGLSEQRPSQRRGQGHDMAHQ